MALDLIMLFITDGCEDPKSAGTQAGNSPNLFNKRNLNLTCKTPRNGEQSWNFSNAVFCVDTLEFYYMSNNLCIV